MDKVSDQLLGMCNSGASGKRDLGAFAMQFFLAITSIPDRTHAIRDSVSIDELCCRV